MIDDADLKVEAIIPKRSGMQVGMAPTTVRVTHLPTGLVAECTTRSQHIGRNICLTMIETILTEPGHTQHLTRIGPSE